MKKLLLIDLIFVMFILFFLQIQDDKYERNHIDNEIYYSFDSSLNKSILEDEEPYFKIEVFEYYLDNYFQYMKTNYKLDVLELNIHYEFIKENICQEININVFYQKRKKIKRRIYLKGTLTSSYYM